MSSLILPWISCHWQISTWWRYSRGSVSWPYRRVSMSRTLPLCYPPLTRDKHQNYGNVALSSSWQTLDRYVSPLFPWISFSVCKIVMNLETWALILFFSQVIATKSFSELPINLLQEVLVEASRRGAHVGGCHGTAAVGITSPNDRE